MRWGQMGNEGEVLDLLASGGLLTQCIDRLFGIWGGHQWTLGNRGALP